MKLEFWFLPWTPWVIVSKLLKFMVFLMKKRIWILLNSRTGTMIYHLCLWKVYEFALLAFFYFENGIFCYIINNWRCVCLSRRLNNILFIVPVLCVFLHGHDLKAGTRLTNLESASRSNGSIFLLLVMTHKVFLFFS